MVPQALNYFVNISEHNILDYMLMLHTFYFVKLILRPLSSLSHSPTLFNSVLLDKCLLNTT